MSEPIKEEVLVLLGNESDENDGRPTLSAIAIERCKQALVYLLKNENENVDVILTGHFGENFNTTDEPHSLTLQNYLIENGKMGNNNAYKIDFNPKRIVYKSLSSNTFEDVLSIRKFIADNKYTKITVVTSDFHMKRVKYLFYQIFNDFHLDFRESDTASNKKQKLENEELEKLEKLKTKWVSIPIYKQLNEGNFPAEIYENATNEQKHYDTISNAVISAIFGATLFPLFSDNDSFSKSVILFSSALISIFLLLMYQRCANSANLARNVLKNIEIMYHMNGFSSNYDNREFVSLGIFSKPETNGNRIKKYYFTTSFRAIIELLCRFSIVSNIFFGFLSL
jgi:hypothetical protein